MMHRVSLLLFLLGTCLFYKCGAVPAGSDAVDAREEEKLLDGEVNYKDIAPVRSVAKTTPPPAVRQEPTKAAADPLGDLLDGNTAALDEVFDDQAPKEDTLHRALPVTDMTELKDPAVPLDTQSHGTSAPFTEKDVNVQPSAPSESGGITAYDSGAAAPRGKSDNVFEVWGTVGGFMKGTGARGFNDYRARREEIQAADKEQGASGSPTGYMEHPMEKSTGAQMNAIGEGEPGGGSMNKKGFEQWESFGDQWRRVKDFQYGPNNKPAPEPNDLKYYQMLINNPRKSNFRGYAHLFRGPNDLPLEPPAPAPERDEYGRLTSDIKLDAFGRPIVYHKDNVDEHGRPLTAFGK